MKKIILMLIVAVTASAATAQNNFKANVSTAKTSYAGGKLEEAHFALQQMLTEIDVTIGKEVLKLLPAKMDTMTAVKKDDNVSGNIGFVGATIHRVYGGESKRGTIDIVNNSPLIGTLNAFLTNPLLANMGGDGNTKVIKVQGYKGRLTKEENSDGGKPGYRLELPFNNAMITFNVTNTTDAEITAMANTLPLAQIAKLIQ